MMHTHDTNAVPLPDRLNEDWRFGRPHVHARELAEILEHAQAAELRGVDLPSGVQLTPCAAEALPSIGSEALMRQALQIGPGQCLRIADGSQLREAISLHSEVHGGQVQQLRVIVGAGARLHLIEEHEYSEESMLVCLRRYELMPGATLRLEQRELGSGNTRAFCISSCICAENARFCSLSTHQDLAWARHECTLELTAPGAEALLLSANRLRSEQCLDMRNRQLHSSPGCKSRLLCKNTLTDRATAIFGGNIRVQPHAHDTDAYLSNLNLQLSPHATVHSLPMLEILADRVRCSHGSATAPVDAEQLFYLQSRGIPLAEARRTLEEAFLADVRLHFEQF